MEDVQIFLAGALFLVAVVLFILLLETGILAAVFKMIRWLVWISSQIYKRHSLNVEYKRSVSKKKVVGPKIPPHEVPVIEGFVYTYKGEIPMDKTYPTEHTADTHPLIREVDKAYNLLSTRVI